MQLTKYNSYISYRSITALVLGFIGNLKGKIKKDAWSLKPFVANDEKVKAEHLWVRFIQNDINKVNNKVRPV